MNETVYAHGYEVKKDGHIEEHCPTGHHCLVKPEKIEEVTKGGIIKPVSTIRQEQGNAQKGVLVALGPQCFKAFDDGAAWAAVGDTVVFARYGGKIHNALEEDNVENALRLLNDEDIMLVIRRKK